MERIKLALEKAREDRLKAGGTAFGSLAHTIPVSADKISYLHTRTEPVEAQLLHEKRVIASNESSPSADAYRVLRTQILQRLRENDWNTLAVTSPSDGEGKTLTAINLAISLAKEVTYTVLLVDANLKQPGVHKYFGLDPKHGLSDYLVNDAPLTSLLINPAGIDRFVILPAGNPLPNSSEMLNSPKMARLVDELKTRYPSRIVLFDLPPLLSSSDALAFSPYVDAALLVLEEGKTQAEDAQRALSLLQKTPVLGTVLNKSRRTARVSTDPRAGNNRSNRLALRGKKLIHTVIDQIHRIKNRLHAKRT